MAKENGGSTPPAAAAEMREAKVAWRPRQTFDGAVKRLMRPPRALRNIQECNSCTFASASMDFLDLEPRPVGFRAFLREGTQKGMLGEEKTV